MKTECSDIEDQKAKTDWLASRAADLYLSNQTLKNRVEILEYHLREVKGCLDEYEQMPCASLLARLKMAIKRAK